MTTRVRQPSLTTTLTADLDNLTFPTANKLRKKFRQLTLTVLHCSHTDCRMLLVECSIFVSPGVKKFRIQSPNVTTHRRLVKCCLRIFFSTALLQQTKTKVLKLLFPKVEQLAFLYCTNSWTMPPSTHFYDTV